MKASWTGPPRPRGFPDRTAVGVPAPHEGEGCAGPTLEQSPLEPLPLGANIAG
jgi:hypothetical protein